MEYAPTPRDPESEARGHELRDVAAKPIIIFLIGLVVFGGALQVVMTQIMNGYVKQDTARAAPPIELLRDPGNKFQVSPNPPLQRDTTKDMIRMYEEEDEILKLKEPTRDRRTGKVFVSVDRAIDIMAKKGMKHRDQAPPKSEKGKYQYSEKARAYQATY